MRISDSVLHIGHFPVNYFFYGPRHKYLNDSVTSIFYAGFIFILGVLPAIIVLSINFEHLLVKGTRTNKF